MSSASSIPEQTSGSLYVGDLAQSVTEAVLRETFNNIGTVLSVRVCRDRVTKHSLGYGYVNFQHPDDALRAIDKMNFDSLHGQTMRISKVQRDPHLRKSGKGNLYIKNLDKSIDNKVLYSTLSAFGDIISCKIAQDEDGYSKGFGFVQFETEEAADKAIEKVNGMVLSDKQVVVCRFKTHLEREKELEERKNNFTNVFIKNIDNDVEEDKLIEMFSKFGKITSCKVAKEESDDEQGDDEVLNIETVADKNKGFAFVNFEDSEAAKKAVEELNGIDMSGKKLFVGRAQKKLERKKELEQQFQELKKEKMKRFVGLNLYVKNLDDSIDDDKLRMAFSPYGTITSAKVMEKEGKSKGFGFVCFTTPEEATKAVTEMNGRIIVAKPLYVALAQRKEDRRVDLAKQHIQKGTKVSYTNGLQQQMGIGGYSMNQAGIGGHSSSMQQHMGMNGHTMQLPPMYRQPNQMPAQPRWPQQGAGPRHGYVHGMNSGMQRNYRMPVRFRQPLQPRFGGGHPQLWGVRQLGPHNVNQWESQQFSGQYGTQSMGHGQPGPNIFGQPGPQFMGRAGPYSQVQPRSQFIGQPTPQHMDHQISHTMGAQHRSSPMSMLGGHAMSEDHTDMNGAIVQLQQGHVYTHTARNHPTQAVTEQMTVSSVPIHKAVMINSQEPLTASMLAGADEKRQKQMLGESLYPVIHRLLPDNAQLVGKITGMVLEIDNSELLHMLEDETSLRAKVDEALAVLEAHPGQEVQQ